MARKKKTKAAKPKKVKAKKTKAKKPSAAPEFQKQRADVYTMMMIVAFLALTLGSVLLYLENERYNWDFKAEEYKKRASVSPTQVEVPGANQTWLA